jgi:hypothetical protein
MRKIAILMALAVAMMSLLGGSALANGKGKEVSVAPKPPAHSNAGGNKDDGGTNGPTAYTAQQWCETSTPAGLGGTYNASPETCTLTDKVTEGIDGSDEHEQVNVVADFVMTYRWSSTSPSSSTNEWRLGAGDTTVSYKLTLPNGKTVENNGINQMVEVRFLDAEGAFVDNAVIGEVE